MKIVIAPNSYKGSLTAFEASDCIEAGIKRAFPKARIIKIPLADGGDGTMEVLVKVTKGSIKTAKVTGPLGNKVKARYGILGDKKTAVIEMAEASGLKLVPEEKRNPLITTTYGVGELINKAIKAGCKKLILGIGGSATVDGGSGMAKAIGYRLLNHGGKDILPGGGSLFKLAKISNLKVGERFKGIDVIVATDVTNLLFGRVGAARVFGPQKGATSEMVATLEKNLKHFAKIINRDLKKDVTKIKGGGAAGGLGAGLHAFLNAKLKLGIPIIMEISGLEKEIKNADLVVTGEGNVDNQSIYGKVPVGVAKLAKKYNVPVLCIVGGIGDITAEFYKTGITGIMNIIKYPMSLEKAMKDSKKLLEDASSRAGQIIKIGLRIGEK